MAFLDNSGDIILDAVLTDTGRMRLAKGDGSFRVAKFALADDEIDYSLYDKTNASGSAYYDLQILQTPILEAFSNNISSMKSKLISISRNNLIFLPVMLVNTNNSPYNLANQLVNNGYVLAVDQETENYLKQSTVTYLGNSVSRQGLLYGNDTTVRRFIQIDQGLNTNEKAATEALDADLVESQYIIEIDNRIASVMSDDGTRQTPSYIDDDNIATYYFSRGVDNSFVSDITTNANQTSGQVIAGPRGTKLMFKLFSQAETLYSDFLFNTLGKDLSTGFGLSVNTIKGILVNVRVMGVTTGYSIDIPIMVVKKIL